MKQLSFLLTLFFLFFSLTGGVRQVGTKTIIGEESRIGGPTSYIDFDDHTDGSITIGSRNLLTTDSFNIDTYLYEDCAYLTGNDGLDELGFPSNFKVIFDKSHDAFAIYQAVAGVDNTQFGVKLNTSNGCGYIIIVDIADLNNGNRSPINDSNWPLGATAETPIFGVMSADATVAGEGIFLWHDSDNGNIESSTGLLNVNGAASFPDMKTGVDQVTAGAVAGELWADSDDDYTIKLGQ